MIRPQDPALAALLEEIGADMAEAERAAQADAAMQAEMARFRAERPWLPRQD